MGIGHQRFPILYAATQLARWLASRRSAVQSVPQGPSTAHCAWVRSVDQLRAGFRRERTRWRAVDRSARVAYSQQWNFNLQREIPGKISIEAAYVGNKGTKLT